MKRLLLLLVAVSATGLFALPTSVSAQACSQATGYLCPAGFGCSVGPPTTTPGTCVAVGNPGSPDPSGGGSDDGSGGDGEDDASGRDRGFLVNPLGDDTSTLNDLLAKILNVVVQIGVVVLTMMLVYCGFLFVTAQGNPENLSKARSALIWTIIGGFLVLGASVIAEAVKSTVEAL